MVTDLARENLKDCVLTLAAIYLAIEIIRGAMRLLWEVFDGSR